MAQQSERLFLEETCGPLKEKLMLKLVEDVNATIHEQDFQDFEVNYVVSTQDANLIIEVKYDFLAEVLNNGSQALLERVWEPFVQNMQLQVESKVLKLGVNAAVMGDRAQACATSLSYTRLWLLCGPLVERSRWLRDETAGVAVGRGAAAACPPLLRFQVRRNETCWIVVKPDRVAIVFSIHLDDEVDVALGRAFCTEFAETKRAGALHALPCSFSYPQDVPQDIQGQVLSPPNVGFLAFTISDQAVRNASEDRLHQMAKPVMCFRNFFIFHLKNCKSYLHSRLRTRLDTWQKGLKAARRQGQNVQRRTIQGKVFDPTARR